MTQSESNRRAVEVSSPLRDRILFLVGARRSGTNWLERILTTHPEIVAMPSETYLFAKGIKPLNELVQHAHPGSRMMASTYMERATYRQAVRELMDTVFGESLDRLGPEARYLLERTPWHSMHLDLIADFYPDAHVIHIVRDGRAVARSLVALPRGPASIGEAAEEWRSSLVPRRRGKDLFGERFAEVKYEVLLDDPLAGARSLFGWLGLEFTSTQAEAVTTEAGFEFNVDPGLGGVRLDKWRDELSDDAIAEVERIAGGELREWGYLPSAREGGEGPPGRTRRERRVRDSRTLRSIASLGSKLNSPRGRHAARATQGELIGNLDVVERFGRLIASGSSDEAATLCTAEGRYELRKAERVVVRGRGGSARAKVIEVLTGYHSELQPLSSDSHVGGPKGMFTVHTYRKDDGSHWTQSGVFRLDNRGLIKFMSIHLFELKQR